MLIFAEHVVNIILHKSGERVNYLVVLGIDPGYAIIGWGIINFNGAIYSALGYGAVTTDAETNFNTRLEKIFDEINLIISKAKPDAMAIEKLYFHNNQKTAINVAQARGVILLAAQKNNLPVYEYTPLQVKMAVTGYGQARKEQIMQMVKILLKLKEVPKPDDTADALAMAVTHIQAAGTNLKELLFKRG